MFSGEKSSVVGSIPKNSDHVSYVKEERSKVIWFSIFNEILFVSEESFLFVESNEIHLIKNLEEFYENKS